MPYSIITSVKNLNKHMQRKVSQLLSIKLNFFGFGTYYDHLVTAALLAFTKKSWLLQVQCRFGYFLKTQSVEVAADIRTQVQQ